MVRDQRPYVLILQYSLHDDKSYFYMEIVSDTVIEFKGLTVVQVSQNQAAVVSDPQNHIFVIKNSGFVAFAIEGTYDVLSIVDQTHLPGVVKDRLTNVILGWTHEVKMKSKVSETEEKEYVVALLYDFPSFLLLIAPHISVCSLV